MTAPDGIDAAAWQAGIDRAREALETAPDRDPGGARTCTAARCKQPATDLSGLCARHIDKAAQR